MPSIKEFKEVFENLTGQTIDKEHLDLDLNIFENGESLGYSQLNEILSLLGQDRICESFFQYLIDGSSEYNLRSCLKNKEDLISGVDRFRKHALLFYGNIRFAFNHLAQEDLAVEKIVNDSLPSDPELYTLRHKPIKKIQRIPKDKTFLLGYLSEKTITEELKKDPTNEKYLKLKEERPKQLKIGKTNQDTYLTYDHMDVYVATSMRLQHEYISVDECINQIFNHEQIAELNLRYFNPTQAYCVGRIEKGLSEALMLKRARCTIYFVQENDTLGKDSELASTLAQGKPVIAFVPEGNKEQIDQTLETLKSINPEKTEVEIILDQLKIFDPSLPWDPSNDIVNKAIHSPGSIKIADLRELLYSKVKSHYDKRANLLKSDHPLGIQVNLKSGVANGVLVVRKIDDCAHLLRTIVLKQMTFKLEHKDDDHLYLIEDISQSIFRLQTADRILSNSFWNFYFEDDDVED